tara:strand:+ start:6409 stop:6906 length:498 start_codon:yes stop_codon:yes gene_type:complete
MKKSILILTLLFSTIIFSQQEIKLNMGNALVLKTIDISYEYYLKEDTSIGLSGLFNFEKKTSDFRYNEESMITPYLRHYFTSDQNWNLFGEGFFGVNTGYKKTEIGGIIDYKRYSDSALGIAVGSKYLSESGFVVDVYGGVGRNLFSANSPVLALRLGINVGWRF